MFVPATIDVTPELVRTPPLFDRPVPSRDVNVEPPNVKFVVDAVTNDPYVVDEYANVCSADHVLAVVVPNARQITFAEFCSGYVKVRFDPPPVTQVPLTAKHPEVILIPFAKVDDAFPVIESAPAESPPANVDVAVVDVAKKLLATIVPATPRDVYGDVVPIPIFPAKYPSLTFGS